MTPDPAHVNEPTSADSALSWLMASDPSIRWQLLRDVLGAAPDVVAAERARVATEGWGAALLSAQREDGTWPGSVRFPEEPTLSALLVLRDMGLDPASAQAERAVARVRAHVRWLMCIAQEELPKREDISWWRAPFFAGEVEPCINGRVLAAGAYFGVDMQPLAERLLREQMSDGGWNCDQEIGSTRGSFHTTLNVLEGLLAFERATGGSPAVTTAMQRGHEYLLSRELFKRQSTGEPIVHDRKGGPAWTQFSYPAGWRYDLLRALDHLRDAGVTPDVRLRDAVALVAARRDAEGRWPLGIVHDGEVMAEPGAEEGAPSGWNTLRGVRVLRWVGGLFAS